MKLVTYRFEDAVCVGAMDETLSAIHPIPGCGDLTALIASGAPIEPAEETISVFDVELLSPIPHPAQDVICLGINYYDHAAESDAVTGKSDNNGCLYRCIIKNSYGSVTSSGAMLFVK